MTASSRRDEARRHAQQSSFSDPVSDLENDRRPAVDDQPIVSKSHRKREAHALQNLGTRLVALSPARLTRLELPEALREAVLAIRNMHQHGARLRQMQYIGRLMRQLEPAELRLVQQALDPTRSGIPPAATSVAAPPQ